MNTNKNQTVFNALAALVAAGSRVRPESIRDARRVGLPCGSAKEQRSRKKSRKKLAQASKRKNRNRNR